MIINHMYECDRVFVCVCVFEGPKTPMLYGNQKAVILCKALPGDCSKGQGNGDSWVPQKDWRIFKTEEQLLPVYVLYIG